MVQKLNLILITSPELAEFRKRLKTLETRVRFLPSYHHSYFGSTLQQQDGQALFITLYRSWCHNAVAAFSLCLLAQAYEHASNLLQILSVHFIIYCVPPAHKWLLVPSLKSLLIFWCKSTSWYNSSNHPCLPVSMNTYTIPPAV
jgi:Vacuolar protein 14 C-terminal Fig4p binding